MSYDDYFKMNQAILYCDQICIKFTSVPWVCSPLALSTFALLLNTPDVEHHPYWSCVLLNTDSPNSPHPGHHMPLSVSADCSGQKQIIVFAFVFLCMSLSCSMMSSSSSILHGMLQKLLLKGRIVSAYKQHSAYLFLIYSYLGSFYLWAVENSTGVKYLFESCFAFFGYVARRRIPESHSNHTLHF